MNPALHGLVVSLLAHAADAWAAGNEARAAVWCERAWAHAAGSEFLDLDDQERTPRER